jgi:hypothetical protein
MRQSLGRIWWVGLISCVFARFLPAQGSLSISTAGTSFLVAAPERQQGGHETNPQQTQDSKPDPPLLADANPQADQAAGRSSDQDLATPSKRMFGMIPDFENTNDIPANRHSLTVREKYILSLHQAFDISAHVGNAFQAALNRPRTVSLVTARAGAPTENVLRLPKAIKLRGAFSFMVSYLRYCTKTRVISGRVGEQR